MRVDESLPAAGTAAAHGARNLLLRRLKIIAPSSALRLSLRRVLHSFCLRLVR
jgi:hypothetical protein